MLYCSISDNGIGRKQSIIQPAEPWKEKKSMGIKVTAHRLELMHQTQENDRFIEIKDVWENDGKNTGTTVSLEIPIELLDTD